MRTFHNFRQKSQQLVNFGFGGASANGKAGSGARQTVNQPQEKGGNPSDSRPFWVLANALAKELFLFVNQDMAIAWLKRKGVKVAAANDWCRAPQNGSRAGISSFKFAVSEKQEDLPIGRIKPACCPKFPQNPLQTANLGSIGLIHEEKSVARQTSNAAFELRGFKSVATRPKRERIESANPSLVSGISSYNLRTIACKAQSSG